MSLFESVSGFAVRHLREEHVARLRGWYRGLRHRLAPVMTVWHGTFGVDDLRRHLDQRCGSDFEILMVHSSVNNLQPAFTGSALELLRALIDWCGPRRTLVMPAFWFGDPQFPDTRSALEARREFDLLRTPSQMGLLSELFRRWAGVVCSRHPLYRVSALGPLARELTRGHELAETACGVGTPFDFMANADTLILGLGKPFEVLTQVHHAEDVLGDQFPVPATPVAPLTMTLIEGERRIPFVLRGRALAWRRNMRRLPQLMDKATLQQWSFHGVKLFQTRAGDVTRCLVAAARRGETLYEEP